MAYFNGEPPTDYAKTADRDHVSYVPINIAQQCHGTDFHTRLEGGRTACQETAAVVFGAWFDSDIVGFCAKHWARFMLALEIELRGAQREDHWLIKAIIEHQGPTLLDKARDEALAEDKARYRQYLHQRAAQLHNQLLAAELTPGPRVYFIQAGKRGPIKIGVATDVRKRLDTLQTASPYRLRVRATVPGNVDTEGAYHRMFADHRMSGEWFKPVAAIRAEIDKINAVKRRGEGALF